MPWISPGPKYPPILFGSPPPLVGGSLPPLIVTPYPPPDLLPESIIIWGVLLGSYIASPWRASTSAQGRRPGGSPAIFKPGAPIWVHSCPLFHLGPIILCCYWLLPVVVDNIYDLLFCYHHLCQLYLDDLHPPPTPPLPRRSYGGGGTRSVTLINGPTKFTPTTLAIYLNNLSFLYCPGQGASVVPFAPASVVSAPYPTLKFP